MLLATLSVLYGTTFVVCADAGQAFQIAGLITFALYMVLFVVAGPHFESRHFYAPSSPWLPDADAGALATLCERNRGLVQYRDQVRALGRRFSRAESAAMFEWAHVHVASIHRANEGYERLYGHPYPATA
ncbi:hypothetical protein G3A43_08325 [Paraburkholderia aspalathi]|nr:hypothetical protein [Paraburkholderia aspalathi]MBK3780262.1 hypothetical protein [Paraburkholderia aspalathi]